MSTFRLFEIGKTGLLAARTGLDITGHNVANVATSGYTRQEAYLEPISHRAGQVTGAGVRVQDVIRHRDDFLDAILRGEMAKKVAFDGEVQVLEHIQILLQEPTDMGIRHAVDSLWAAWQDLSSEPDSEGARAQVAERGSSLCDLFRHMGCQLDSLKRDVENAIVSQVERANQLSREISGLNTEIIRCKTRGEPVSDLLDQRDLLFDELTMLTGAAVSYTKEGAARASLMGFPLVDGAISHSLSVHFLDDETQYSWVNAAGKSLPLKSMGGKLEGFTRARDDRIGGFKKELQDLLGSLVERVNSEHAKGYPIEDEGEDETEFFHMNPDDVLATVRVNPRISQNPFLIRASKAQGDTLNGENALGMARAISGEEESYPASFEKTWMGMVGKIGALAQQVTNGSRVQELLVKDLENRKDSISGVSLDEEIATLVRQQHCFTAAARVISMADQMVDTLINRLGAGRY